MYPYEFEKNLEPKASLHFNISHLVDFFEKCGYKVNGIFVKNDIDEAKRKQGKKVFAIQFSSDSEAKKFCEYVKTHRGQLGAYGIFRLQGHQDNNNAIFSLQGMIQLLNYLPFKSRIASTF